MAETFACTSITRPPPPPPPPPSISRPYKFNNVSHSCRGYIYDVIRCTHVSFNSCRLLFWYFILKYLSCFDACVWFNIYKVLVRDDEMNMISQWSMGFVLYFIQYYSDISHKWSGIHYNFVLRVKHLFPLGYSKSYLPLLKPLDKHQFPFQEVAGTGTFHYRATHTYVAMSYLYIIPKLANG